MPKKLKSKLNWPALSTVQFNVVPDSTFNIGSGITTITPNLVSLLWGMPPDSYEANRILYPEKTVVNPHMGENTIIYNPNTNNRDAVALDALHVMHDSPIYLELYNQYVQSLPQGFEPLMDAANDEFGDRGMTIIEKYLKGLPLSQEEQEAIEPIYDALLRRQFAPDYMRNIAHGYLDKATLPIIESIGMSGDEAIRNYMESYPLKEVTVTANKKANGGELNLPLDWNELSMKEKAAYIRMGVASGYKDIDSIKGVYNQFKKGGPTRKQVFLNTLELSLTNNSRYNTPGWRKYLTDLANMESGYQAGITNSIGAKGYFQLMPDNRAASWSTPTQLFDEMYRMTDANIDYLRRNMTTADLKKADELGIDIYGLMAGAHLGGAKNALKALRGTKNAKDMNGTSVMSYMTRFSQTTPRVTGIEGGMIPIIDNTYLASPEDEAISNTVVVDPNAVLEEIKGNIPQAITIDDKEPIAMTRDIPEVTVIGHQKPNLVAMQDFIDTVSNSTTPMQPIYQLQEPVAMKDVMQQVNNDRVTFLQKDLEDRLLADERRRRLGYDYMDSLTNDIEDLRFYRNMSAEGGYLFPTGGPLITVNPGDRVFTDECALWSNSTLRDNGYLINGNAWNLGNVDMLYNGFNGLTRTETYDSLAVMDYNHQATLNVFKNFDSKTLDTKKPYVVNMFYNNSPSLETAYNEGDEVTGTHTGLLTFDPDTKKWWVTHNIHGNIHQEPFGLLLKSDGKYGVTAIYAPRKKTVWNRVKGFFGFANGGSIANKYDGFTTPTQQMLVGIPFWLQQVVPSWYDTVDPPINGGTLPEVIVTPTDDQDWLFSQGRYAHNSRKPLADKATRQMVALYLSLYDNEDTRSYNERIRRLADIMYATNGVIFKANNKEGKLKGRAHYVPSEEVGYITTMPELFAEISHPYQEWFGNNEGISEYEMGNYDGDSDPRGGTRYAYPDTHEGETHGFFEPALTEWVETGKIKRSLPFLDKDKAKLTIIPKDWHEVVDSAKSWNLQAIDKRIISMPSLLNPLQRLKYSIIDFPLLEKKKALGGFIPSNQ